MELGILGLHFHQDKYFTLVVFLETYKIGEVGLHRMLQQGQFKGVLTQL
jgi:hypothetical protein